MDLNSILILLAFLLIIYLILRRIGVSGGVSLAVNEPPPGIDWQAIKNEDVQLALQQGHEIEAIKHYRLHTGAGLAEAKRAIGFVMAYPQAAESARERRETMPTALSAVDQAEIRDLLNRRQKIQAVKRYRETMGVELKDAKDAVDAIERAMNVN